MLSFCETCEQEIDGDYAIQDGDVICDACLWALDPESEPEEKTWR